MIRTHLTSLALAVAVATAAAATGALAQDTLKSGSFRGAGGHKSSGQVRIVKDGGVTKVVFANNFRLDGAPDARVAFGNGRYARGTIIAKLRRLKGGQSYAIPRRINIAKYSQVWLWCLRYNVPLAVANAK